MALLKEDVEDFDDEEEPLFTEEDLYNGPDEHTAKTLEDEKVERYIRAIKATRAEKAEWEDRANAELERLSARMEDRSGQYQRKIDFLTSMLAQYALIKGIRKREFLSGTLNHTARRTDYKIVKPEDLMAWIDEEGMDPKLWLNVTRKPVAATMKQHVKTVGELPPGVDIVSVGGKFKVD